MERDALKQLEGPFIEFKRTLDDPLALAKTLIAFAEALHISYDETAVREAPLEALQPSLFEEYMAHRQRFRGTDPQQVSLDLMLSLKAAVREGEEVFPTVGGLLLFSEAAVTYLPQARLRCARFKGTTTDVFIDQREIAGPLWRMVDEAMHFIKRNIRLSGEVEGIHRTDRYQYPLPVLREALLNAVAHRDYAIREADIRLAVFDDCIEITSPGLLPAGISIEQLGTGASEVRNRMIARILKDMGLIEEWGRGTRVMKQEMRARGLPEPRFAEIGRSFRVTLFGAEAPPEETVPPRQLNERRSQALRWLRQVSSVTVQEYRTRFGVSRATAYLDLRALTEAGLVVPHGAGPSRRYSLPDRRP